MPTENAAPTAPHGPVLRVNGVTKAFGATVALRDASFELDGGEIHAIVGENGSGKSTLVKILSGVHRPDSGQLLIGGEEVSAVASPSAATRADLATVFQEVLVVEPRSVVENVWLGCDGIFSAALPQSEKRRIAGEILERLLGAPAPLDAPTEALSLSDRQACCLARALVRNPRVLVLDEATSALDVATRGRLFDVLRERVAQGASVIFISHRMDEIAEIADRVTVMRSGSTVATLDAEAATPQELVRLMTGAEHLAPSTARERAGAKANGEVLLAVDSVCLRPGAAPISARFHAGEVVGLAGLEGHGQDDFLRTLSAIGGALVAYVPRERRAESTFESKSVVENFGIPTLQRDVVRGLLRPSRTRARFAEYVGRLGIKLDRDTDSITTLSGGNQQKVVIARWLATGPRVLLLNDPTRGIDLGAKRDIYRLLAELASDGVCIVMLSTEVDEHVELMDRVLVFHEHTVYREIPHAQLSRSALVSAFFGREEAVSA